MCTLYAMLLSVAKLKNKSIVDEHGENIANACMVAMRAHIVDGLIGSPSVNRYKVMVVNRFIDALATLLVKTSFGRLYRVNLWLYELQAKWLPLVSCRLSDSSSAIGLYANCSTVLLRSNWEVRVYCPTSKLQINEND